MKWFEKSMLYPLRWFINFLGISEKKSQNFHNRKYFELVENNQGIIIIDEEFKVVFRSSSSARLELFQ
jgi:hypothetical protein